MLVIIITNSKDSINFDGTIKPGADATQDLGSSELSFANIFSADVQLSNEGSANDVDGTWGKYTIQEGEDDLFLINPEMVKNISLNCTQVNIDMAIYVGSGRTAFLSSDSADKGTGVGIGTTTTTGRNAGVGQKPAP